MSQMSYAWRLELSFFPVLWGEGQGKCFPHQPFITRCGLSMREQSRPQLFWDSKQVSISMLVPFSWQATSPAVSDNSFGWLIISPATGLPFQIILQVFCKFYLSNNSPIFHSVSILIETWLLFLCLFVCVFFLVQYSNLKEIEESENQIQTMSSKTWERVVKSSQILITLARTEWWKKWQMILPSLNG